MVITYKCMLCDYANKTTFVKNFNFWDFVNSTNKLVYRTHEYMIYRTINDSVTTQRISNKLVPKIKLNI